MLFQHTTKFETATNLKKRIRSALVFVFLVMKIRKNIQSMYSKNVNCEEKHVNLLLIGEGSMFLSKILIYFSMIIRYIVEEKNFVVNFWKLFKQQKKIYYL